MTIGWAPSIKDTGLYVNWLKFSILKEISTWNSFTALVSLFISRERQSNDRDITYFDSLREYIKEIEEGDEKWVAVKTKLKE